MKDSKLSIGNCHDLIKEQPENSIDALVTDPPYGLSFQNAYWDKDLPDPAIWEQVLRVLKPGSFGLIFTSIRLMHRLMCAVEDHGFKIKDVLMWGFLNGMPKSRDVALDIDKEQGIPSEVIGKYNYVQGYKAGGSDSYAATEGKNKLAPASDLAKTYKGSGLGIKPAYEPIIMVQKPLDKDLTVAQNVIKYGVGALNLEETRLPYGKDDEGKKIGHNPHPLGRVCADIARTDEFNDDYDKFFLVPKVRQHKDDFNKHPTIKPTDLMVHLVKLVTWKDQWVLDPFIGSGSTGVACIQTKRKFIGYEMDENFYAIAEKRLLDAQALKMDGLE